VPMGNYCGRKSRPPGSSQDSMGEMKRNSYPDFSAMLTAIAFDDGRLRWSLDQHLIADLEGPSSRGQSRSRSASTPDARPKGGYRHIRTWAISMEGPAFSASQPASSALRMAHAGVAV
jgi:hypothetical protein